MLEVDSSIDQDDFNDVPEVITPISFNQKSYSVPFQSKFQGAFQRQLTKIVEDNPPLPLFPRSSTYQGESPRSGSSYNFLKLSKFRGKDFGKSKMEQPDQFDKFVFPQNIISLKQVFEIIESHLQPSHDRIGARLSVAKKFQESEDAPQFAKHKKKKPTTETELNTQEFELINPENANKTLCGEIVYLKCILDWKDKQKSKRDIVLEENLLDVKRMLKNSIFIPSPTKLNADGEMEKDEKKVLVKVNVEPFYTRKSPIDQTLIFESRFESGNLAASVKVSDVDYLLLL